jgi:mannose-6-phosphate isomerase-like protein (cupin superfamily)
MAELIAQPRIVMASGNKPKQIAEYVGRLNSGTEALSIARMMSPSGWSELGQTPDFDEYTLVLRGLLRVHTRAAVIDIYAGQAVVAQKGEWVSYSTPGPNGAEYVAVCLPAFSTDLVHRDDHRDT